MREKSFDIVIVGSGAGGGVVAQELSALCADGVRIAVLEWGAKLREQEFTGRELEMAQRLYFDAGGFLTKDRNMTLAFGCAYGGSTVVNTGTSLVIPRQVVKRWAVDGLQWEDLRSRSEKYMAENSVHLLEAPQINENNRLFFQACRELGFRVGQFPINVKGCKGSGLCNLGCPNAAKQGTHRVQLPRAEKNGVEVITNCRVVRIADKSCYACVRNRAYGEPSAWEPGEYRIKARVVVLCAGAINSPALLLRSRLPVNLPSLGRYLTTHPAVILVGQHERPITNFYGHPKSYYCDHFVHSKRFILETCMYFPFTTAKNLIGFGPEHEAFLTHMDRLQMILVLAIDRALARNRVSVDRRGNPRVDYRLTDEVLDSLYASMQVCTQIFFAAGAQCVHAPASKKFAIEASERDRLDKLILRNQLKPGKVSITSAHLMGGCRMGSNPATSVTNAWGEVHGVPWLFVADASLFPKCSEVNPYLTIMALADRVAQRVRSRARALLAA